MSLPDGSAPISAQARLCLVSFQQCLQHAVCLDTQRYSNLEDQMARFSIWTSNMAVFAKPKACMDHRVREVPDVKRLILGILDVLQGRIQECDRIAGHATNPNNSVEARMTLLALGDFERTAGAIASQVTLLHALSNTIRKASRESQNVAAAAAFRIRDDDGNDMEECLRHYFLKALDDQFPESSKSIRERLSSTMILRRKRILHRRDRYVIKPAELPLPALKPIVQLRSQPKPEPFEDGNNTTERNSERVQTYTTPSIVDSAMQSATTLALRTFQRASAPSVISYTKTVDLSAHEDLVFPPMPQAQSHVMVERTCPYCLFALPVFDTSTQARWREHVLGDLDALVCLFEPCDEPETLYSHSKDWLQHMRKHTQRWRCPAKSHGPKDFQSRGDFDAHFREDHNKQYSNTQLDLLAERALQSHGTLFEVCPLCGATDAPDESGSLTDHIVGHLRSLALKSLPPHYYDGDDISSNVDAEGSNGSRSTLKDLLNDQKASLALSTSPILALTPIDPEHQLEISPPSAWADEPATTRPWTDLKPGPLSSSEASSYQGSLRLPQRIIDIPLRRTVNTLTPFLDLARDGSFPAIKEFEQQILHLNPKLGEHDGVFLGHLAQQQYMRYGRLLRNRVRHSAQAGAQQCPSRARCKSRGGLTISYRTTEAGVVDISPEDFPPGIPLPPSFSLPAEFECEFCFQVKKIPRPRDWTQHIHEDLQSFTCIWDSCRESGSFKSKLDWVRHMGQHRFKDRWTCDVVDCRYTCYNMDTFHGHLFEEHNYFHMYADTPEALVTRRKVEECRQKIPIKPQDEHCRFCGITLSTWTGVYEHLAEHLERISLLILELVAQQDTDPYAIPVPTTYVSPRPQNEDAGLLSPTPASRTNETFAQRLQAANNQHLSANTAHTVPAESKSPFKIASPLAPGQSPASLSQVSSGKQPSAAQQLEEKKEQREEPLQASAPSDLGGGREVNPSAMAIAYSDWKKRYASERQLPSSYETGRLQTPFPDGVTLPPILPSMSPGSYQPPTGIMDTNYRRASDRFFDSQQLDRFNSRTYLANNLDATLEPSAFSSSTVEAPVLEAHDEGLSPQSHPVYLDHAAAGSAEPKLERTMMDIYSDGLYNSNSEFPSVPPSQPSRDAVPPINEVFLQRLRDANNQHLNVNSAQAPGSIAQRGRSPFRDGSPLAPKSAPDSSF